jgi:dihydrofolate synthase/folylpolyglutamate synthase
MSESILRYAGWKTGLYTSPHLVKLEERIRVNGRTISSARLCSLAARIQQEETALLRAGKIDRPLSYFEFITGSALLHFAQQRIDVAVVEVGLGGRLDATNVVDPAAAVITGIALDHEAILGDTIKKIAIEKAGIIKWGVPVISGCRGDARRVIQAQARKRSAPLLEIDRHCSIHTLRERDGRFTFDLNTPLRSYRGLHLALAGEHQIRNATLAVAAVEALHAFPVKAIDVHRGLSLARWPGRMDEYRIQRRTLLDGAHNAEGALLLKKHLLKQKAREIHLVFGVLRDKDFRKMGNCLFPLARSIHLTGLANSRAMKPEEIAQAHQRFLSRIRQHKKSREAIQAAWQECPRNGIVVVSGSLYLIGEILPWVQ